VHDLPGASVVTAGAVAVRVERTGARLASDVRTASSVWTRFRGLMGRRALSEGEGLWLPGDTSIHMLFMRIPIDAVFLAPADAAGASPNSANAWRVISIRPRLPPWSGVVWYVRAARGCLELEAGAAERAGLLVGDVVRFESAADTTGRDAP
jgi:hypothetical protein